MPATFDPLLGKLRKKDFTEADIRKIAEEEQGEPVREVESVATYADLEAIQKPSERAIYIVTATNNLYRYNGSEFVQITNTMVDNTIYVSDLDELLSMELESAKVYKVLHAHQTPSKYDITIGSTLPGHGYGTWQILMVQQYYPTEITLAQAQTLISACTDSNTISLINVPEIVKTGLEKMRVVTVDETYYGDYTFEAYILTVDQNDGLTITGRLGWAQDEDGAWNWSRYSYDGGVTPDIESLQTQIDAIPFGRGTGQYSAKLKNTGNIASGNSAVADGSSCEASGNVAHAEGYTTKASGLGSHSEGRLTHASGRYAHAEGEGTKAIADNQHVEGKYNATNLTYAFIIGNGEDDSHRSNAFAVKWDGTIVVWNNGTAVEITPAMFAGLLALANNGMVVTDQTEYAEYKSHMEDEIDNVLTPVEEEEVLNNE